MTAPFESVLIANRGEIACRIIATCRRLGIRTIAVHSEAERDALHVGQADASHCIGPAAASQSYLRADAIMAAARAHGARAIHPGYGFLSERVDLASLCAAEGVAWIGPSPRCIAAMGSKIAARGIAGQAGVACVPGYDGADQAAATLAREAARIGYPVLIKASAGGGGRGMRRVEEAAGFDEALAAARAEAQAAFGDARVLVEKYLVRPRHLEVQLAGDRHGGLVHLFERECSIQRHYQKLVEEAPAAHLPPDIRATLLEAALRLGRAIGYDSLGTAEFILGEDGVPRFLEMNTRLQVEHTVTEAITGLDLVEWQLRIAAGEPLPLTQAAIVARGHAIEVRLNAEDPAGFVPQAGRILAWRAPAGIRVDAGIATGSVVTPFYDSLLAKLIAHAATREAARDELDRALGATVALGVVTNQGFLRDLIRRPEFAAPLSTGYIAECYPDGWQAPAATPALRQAAAILHAAERLREARPAGPWGAADGFRVGGRAGAYPVRVADETVAVAAAALGAPLAAGAVDGDDVWLLADGVPLRLRATSLLAHAARPIERDEAEGAHITAAMPGLIAQIKVAPGDEVRRGDVVVVLEAMKLMLPLTAPTGGRVVSVHCRQGEIVASRALLVVIGASDLISRP